MMYKGLFTLLSFAFVTHAVYKYFTRKKKEEKLEEINEVLMFSYGEQFITKSKHSPVMKTQSQDRFFYFLKKPRYNLDICMYVLTDKDITQALLKLNYRGVKIRIIVDAELAYTQGSGIKRLAKYGIPVRWIKSTNLMHHKFCLADTLSDDSRLTPFLMTGSLNWTSQGLCGNYENYLVTSQKELVRQYKDEFERLWILFKPIVD